MPGIDPERAPPFDINRCHRWYSFIQAFSAQLVRHVLSKFSHSSGLIFDPFVGTGTTCVECKIQGIPSVGIDANPMALFASRVKTTWDLDIQTVQKEKEALLSDLQPNIKDLTISSLSSLKHYIETQNISREVLQETLALLSNEDIDPILVAKCLIGRNHIEKISDPKTRDFFRLALASTLVKSANIRSDPESGRKKPKVDVSVLKTFDDHLKMMISDLIHLQRLHAGETRIEQGDARQVLKFLGNETVRGVITSPPYPVDTDYTRQTRLELAILGLVRNLNDLQKIEQTMIRGSRRQIFKEDHDFDQVQDFPEIQAVISELVSFYHNARDPNDYSKMYPRLLGEYFGGMYSHFEQLYEVLQPNGWTAYVVGDKILFKKIPIRTAEILAKLAHRLGYNIKGIEFWRNRISTDHKIPLPENILFLSKE